MSTDIRLIYEGKTTMEERGVAEWKGTFIIKINSMARGASSTGGERRAEQAREVHISERTSLEVPTVEKWYPERKSLTQLTYYNYRAPIERYFLACARHSAELFGRR